MLIIKVSDVPGFDGAYDWDETQQFNGHELHVIKKVAGVRLGEITEALTAGDYDLIVAIAAITIWRAGRVTRDRVPDLVEMLLSAEGGKITIDQVDEAVDADDPPSEASPGHDSTSDANESSAPSFADSNSTGDDPPAISLRAIGLPG